MTVGIATSVRNSRVQQIQVALDAGAAGGKIKFYNGTQPSTGGTATTLLATARFPKPSAPAASGGVLTFNAISPDTNAAATGTATWARLTDSNDTFVADCTVTAVGGGGDIQLISTSVTAGGTVAINTASITDGNP